MRAYRRFLLAGLPGLLAACASPEPPPSSPPPEPPLAAAEPPAPEPPTSLPPAPDVEFPPRIVYAAINTEPFPVPAVNLRRIDARFLRREVAYPRGEEPGTVVVDITARFAYLVLPEGRAMRYGIAVGREQIFLPGGEAMTVGRKAEWPSWRPTPAMVARQPERYGPLRDGLPGGSRSPLGARALYLYQDGIDTRLRLHGTIEPWSIGTMASSGCIRLINQDVIDLYRRVPVGSPVVILPAEVSVG